MTHLFAAVCVFLLSHMVPALPGVRGRMIAVLGRRGYLAGYSVLSLVVLAWVGHAYAQAPYMPLWPQDPVARWVPAVLMFPACLLLVGGLVTPNPLSLSLRRQGFDPARPGLLAVVRHPVPWALVLWAAGHMAVRGDVAAWVLFGLLLVLSLAGMPLLDLKRRRSLGEDEWRRLAAGTSVWPFQALVSGQRRWVAGRLVIGGRAVLIVAGAAALYRLLLALHEPVIGISPWPM